MGKRRFWASVSGDSSTEASRGGSQHISSHTRGWNGGIEVHGYINQHSQNEFEIYTTGGSNDPSRRRLVAIVTENDIKEVATL